MLGKNFCAAPFVGLVASHDATLLPCCEYNKKEKDNKIEIKNVELYRKTELKHIRDSMLADQPLEGCQNCVKKESNPAYVSTRQKYNRDNEFRINYRTKQYLSGQEPGVSQIEIRLANYCNLKCIMCGSYASSSIMTEYNQHREKYNKINVYMGDVKTIRWWDDDENIAALGPILTDAEIVHFAGGEPLIVNKMADILELINPRTTISLNTNFFQSKQRNLDALKKFREVHFIISLDAVGEMYNYIRSGANWDDVKKNIDSLYKYPRFKVGMHTVLQHASVFALPGLLEFLETQTIQTSLHEVHNDSYPGNGAMTINSVHPADIEKFKRWLDKYNGVFKEMLTNWVNAYRYDPDANKRFHQYVEVLDSIRGTSFKETFNPTYDQ